MEDFAEEVEEQGDEKQEDEIGDGKAISKKES